MKRLYDQRSKVLLWIIVAVTLTLMSAGTLFAAGEQLQRRAILSGGSTHSSNGLVMRDVIGQTAAGSYIAPNGVGLCSGFGCGVRTNATPDDPDDPQIELFMPQIKTQEAN